MMISQLHFLSRDGYLIVGGNIYDSCQFGNSTVYGRGYTDAFVAKIDTSNGNVIWVKTAGSAMDMKRPIVFALIA